ncbi:hypothetical protein TNIN_453971 [Trichonephila inaurata madagascariensis]|uniref:Uncharacterized protein n=1 Tax=Trichonephila inaurata madagascariensis TaxID=2747483 RepID=A0A8X6XA49_9ARAC|nr:hypothetical protein TNIN_453971 [Trichonephila inaurata madagascariensis]
MPKSHSLVIPLAFPRCFATIAYFPNKTAFPPQRSGPPFSRLYRHHATARAPHVTTGKGRGPPRPEAHYPMLPPQSETYCSRPSPRERLFRNS